MSDKSISKQVMNVCLIIFLVLNVARGSFSSVRSVIDLSTRISRLTVSHTSAEQVDLYVASTNHLYRLVDSIEGNITTNKELKLKVDLVTGPKSQRYQCAFLTSSSSSSSSSSTGATSQCIKYICDEDSVRSKLLNTIAANRNSQSIDNENRLLLVDEYRQQLVECATTDYGACRLRSLTDLQIIGCNYSAPVIPFSTARGVIVGGGGPTHSSSLYLMVSMENEPQQQQQQRLDKSDFPVFSIRNLEAAEQTALPPTGQQTSKLQLFQLKYPIEYMNYDQTLFDAEFHMRIKYSFKHNGYIYFLFTITNKILTSSCTNIVTAPANNQTESTVVTRMLRICDTSHVAAQASKRDFSEQEAADKFSSVFAQSATNLATLSELVIDCEENGVKYELLQSAHLLSGQGVADPVLFMSFNTTSNQQAGSATCSIRLGSLESHYSNMLRRCLDGDNTHVELISPYSNKATWKAPCRCSMITDYWKNSGQPDDLLNDRKLFCHNDYFNYMNSRQPLTLNAIKVRNEAGNRAAITSLVSLHNHDANIVLVGATVEAKIFMATYNLDTNEAVQYDQVDLLATLGAKSFHKSASHDINLAIADDSQLPVSAGTAIDRSLYATFDHYLFKVDLQHCQQFQTCDSCLSGHNNQNGNPFCGWCVYEQRCVPQHLCKPPADSAELNATSSTWLSRSRYRSECPRILAINPSHYMNPTVLLGATTEFIEFELNLRLLKAADYFCDVNVNLNQFSAKSLSYSTMLNRVQAARIPPTTLQCNLTHIKHKFRQLIRQVPIETKFANLTMQIRALLSSEESTTSGVPTILATTSLYAFNCSYFTRCDQCLSPHLGAGCVWCAANDKCVFNTRLGNEVHNELFASDYEDASCPNELDRMEAASVCTSFALNATTTTTTASQHHHHIIQIPYSAESSISRFTQLSIGSEQHSYPLKLRCFFTKSDEARVQLLGSSELTWTGEVNSLNRRVYDCTCSPHLIEGMRADVAAQSVYLSVWWTTSQTFDDELVHNLTGWNQIRSGETNAALDLFAPDDLLNKKDFIRVDILNCDMKASSCGACMDKELIDLGCGWCRSSSTCSMKKDCGADWMSQLGLSGGTNTYCADPSVEAMSPRCGPAQSGGTQLSLSGTNLGLTHNDVKVRLRPSSDLNDEHNDLECDVISELYTKASRIVCRTQSIGDDPHLEGQYSVYVQTNTQHADAIYSSFNRSKQFLFNYIVSIYWTRVSG